jgi:hypothetical protein
MAIYRFRVFWDENENVERVIQIKSHQTFEEFYKIIVESFQLPTIDTSASFFTSDDYWDKHLEITYKEEDIQGGEKLMRKTKIASLIEQPHQRFVLVYDPILQLTFNIELLKIESEKLVDENENFPKVISSKNKIPKRRTTLQTKKDKDLNATSNLSNNISDDDIDAIIYQTMMNKEISEEDILNGNLDAIFGDINTKTNKDILDDEDDEIIESDEMFEEEDDIFDNDDFDNDGFYDVSDDNEH